MLLPDVMPDLFQSTYTPIAAAGTDAQVKHMARLLGSQLVTAGLGLGGEVVPDVVSCLRKTIIIGPTSA